MNFKEIVSEELGTDLDAIKAQIKQLQANILEKDKIVLEKDKTIKGLQDRLNKSLIPKKPEKRVGIGTRKIIQKTDQVQQTQQTT